MASTGLTVALIKALAGAGIDPSQLETALAEYLEEHPEALQTDVQIDGTSITNDGVANIPIGSNASPGVFKAEVNDNNNSYGLGKYSSTNSLLCVVGASDAQVKAGSQAFRPIVPARQHISAFYALAKASGDTSQASSNNSVGTYTETAKSKISDMLNAPETVSGSTPSITAKSGVRYICGEVSTLSVTAPASGCIDVLFESGSTATVLTVTSAKTGVSAIKWIGADDPTALEANKTYEINIMDGEFGVIASWT